MKTPIFGTLTQRFQEDSMARPHSSIIDIRRFFHYLQSWDVAIKYLYRPSQYYPERKYDVLLKRVGNWALFRVYNTHGGPNPVVDSN